MLEIKGFANGEHEPVVKELGPDQRWMLMVLAGKGVVEVKEPKPFQEGTVLFLTGSDGFKVIEGEMLSGFIICFDRLFIDYFLMQYPLGRALRLIEDDVVLEIDGESLTEAIYRLFEMRRLLGTRIGPYHLKLMFSLLMLDIVGENLNKSTVMGTVEPLLVEFLNLLERNFKKERYCSFYADSLGVTMRKLNCLCRGWFLGRGVAQVHMERLLSEAEYLLLGTDKSIKEIAFELEFCSQQHFRGYFSKSKRMSPSAFRREHTLSKRQI